jgi:uncharacterized membrane protein YeaQ/YmgE (transglycosylase-associated protein family)
VLVSGPTALLVVSILVLAGGFVAAAAARFLLALRRPPRLGWAASTLCGIVGAGVGAAGIALALGRPVRDVPVAVVLGGVAGTLVVLFAADLVSARRADSVPTVAQLVATGESAHLEFKSSARYNHHTGVRDARLEVVIATTVAGFFNARGGWLLIGVDDDGEVVGLDDDYGLMRRPDRDSYELWLRDLLTTTLGAPAAQAVRIAFESVNGKDVCLLQTPLSRRPVFLRASKQRTEFVVRVGNSTRQLDAHDTVEYAATRWSKRVLARRRASHQQPTDAPS